MRKATNSKVKDEKSDRPAPTEYRTHSLSWAPTGPICVNADDGDAHSRCIDLYIATNTDVPAAASFLRGLADLLEKHWSDFVEDPVETCAALQAITQKVLRGEGRTGAGRTIGVRVALGMIEALTDAQAIFGCFESEGAIEADPVAVEALRKALDNAILRASEILHDQFVLMPNPAICDEFDRTRPEAAVA